MDFKYGITMFVAGSLPAEALPEWAGDAMVAGYDSRSLCILAGSIGDREEFTTLFYRAIKELKVELPTFDEARIARARELAEAIIDGRIGPYDGALKIWLEVGGVPPELKQLKGFLYLVYAYEEEDEYQKKYVEDIICEARKFLKK